MEKTKSLLEDNILTSVEGLSRSEIILRLRNIDYLPLKHSKMTDAELKDLLQKKYDEGMLGFLFKR
jgi:hypothetical protein